MEGMEWKWLGYVVQLLIHAAHMAAHAHNAYLSQAGTGKFRKRYVQPKNCVQAEQCGVCTTGDAHT